jgi:hypothetical protein
VHGLKQSDSLGTVKNHLHVGNRHECVTECHFNLTLPVTAVLFLRLSFILSVARVEFELDESCFRRDVFPRVA